MHIRVYYRVVLLSNMVSLLMPKLRNSIHINFYSVIALDYPVNFPEQLKSISMVIGNTFSDSYVRNQLPRKLHRKDRFIAYDQMIMPF